MSTRDEKLRKEKFLGSSSGATAVEFAMLAPLYLLLFLGMTAYGIYFGASHSVQQLAADTARAAIAGIDSGERRLMAEGFIVRNADGYLFIDPNKLSVTVGDSPLDPSQFNVEVSYDARDLPIWGLFDGISMPSTTISRRSTIRIGGA